MWENSPFVDHFFGETMAFPHRFVALPLLKTAGEKTSPDPSGGTLTFKKGGRVPIAHTPLSEAALGLGPQILSIFHCDRTLESWLGFGKSSPNGRTI